MTLREMLTLFMDRENELVPTVDSLCIRHRFTVNHACRMISDDFKQKGYEWDWRNIKRLYWWHHRRINGK